MDIWYFSIGWPLSYLWNFCCSDSPHKLTLESSGTGVNYVPLFGGAIALLLLLCIVGFYNKDKLMHFLVHYEWLSRLFNSSNYKYQQQRFSFANCRYCYPSGFAVTVQRDIEGLKHPVPLRPASPQLLSTTVIQDTCSSSSSHNIMDANTNVPTANVDNVPTVAPVSVPEDQKVSADTPQGSDVNDRVFIRHASPADPILKSRPQSPGKKQQKRAKKANGLKVNTDIVAVPLPSSVATARMPPLRDQNVILREHKELHKRHNVHHYDDMDIPLSSAGAPDSQKPLPPLYSPFSCGLSIPLQKQALSHSAPNSPTFEARPAPTHQVPAFGFSVFNEHQKKQQFAVHNLFEQQQLKQKQQKHQHIEYPNEKQRSNHSKRTNDKVTITDFRKAALSTYQRTPQQSSHVNHHQKSQPHHVASHHEYQRSRDVHERRGQNDDFSLFDRRMSAVLGKSPDNW